MILALTDATWLAIVTLIVGQFGSIAMGVLAYLKGRSNAAAIDQVHLTLNSRLTQLLESARGQAHAEGVTAGEAAQRGRQGLQDHGLGPIDTRADPPRSGIGPMGGPK